VLVERPRASRRTAIPKRRETDGPEVPRPSEALLIELAPLLPSGRIGCTTVGRAQLAAELAFRDPNRVVDCTLFDLHLLERARAATVGKADANLKLECRADLPEQEFDAVALPLRAGGDAEFAWDLLQQAYLRLVDGGLFFVAVDEPRDHWVAGRMEALFGKKFTRHPADEAIAYHSTKRGALKKVKRFECEFQFRDRDHLVKGVSRPGVFSHRRLDLGARALIESLAEPVEESEPPQERDLLAAGARVLDLGCGSGVVGFAAALRAPDVRVHALDSMPRAVECARRGAALNGLANYVAEVADDGRALAPASFDVVLANPPYYSQERIAELFVAAAARVLVVGGRLHVVTKHADWLAERLPVNFADTRVRAIRDYFVVDGVRR
jgi:16S rRNA (guanine1207-N2)-methyltransferase